MSLERLGESEILVAGSDERVEQGEVERADLKIS